MFITLPAGANSIETLKALGQVQSFKGGFLVWTTETATAFASRVSGLGEFGVLPVDTQTFASIAHESAVQDFIKHRNAA